MRLSCTLNTSTNRSACTARPTWLPWPRGVAVSAGVCPGAARSRSAGRRFESPTPGNGRCLHGFTAHALGLIAQRPRRWGGHIGRQPSVALEATAFESPRGMRNGVFQGLRAVKYVGILETPHGGREPPAISDIRGRADVTSSTEHQPVLAFIYFRLHLSFLVIPIGATTGATAGRLSPALSSHK